MNKFVIASLAAFLVGCAALPGTVDEIKAAGKAKYAFCSEKSYDETVNIIQRQLGRCYAHGMQEIYGGTSNTYIEKLKTAENTITLSSVAEVNWSRSYQMRVDVSSNDSCAAFVEAYGASDHWLDMTKIIQSWIKGEDLDKC
ncbi:hypothetical protein PVT67_05320 [Gallaecimonas kandeliae]|uniref:hypothetical protein n=1 Tax=Gallaecimonas kandeliae TaxID=3029055 RepID=UPI0026471CC2|nr:hypothetical protein [Gallaecimonas kandeliae]WKE66666.1 hypothetical protein PVT67_05320 [Gallaecimonas kandeliae]